MIIEALELDHFRNYKQLAIRFEPGTTIFYGDNAQGKTNILEAMYLCSTTRSHRGSKDKEMIQFENEESHIKLLLRKREIPYRIDIHLRKNRPKGIAINGIPIKKASELFGIVNMVFFSPEDLDIIKRGPAERRRFMDMELCQLDRVYVSNLVNYNKCLIQRNQLLKDIDYNRQLIDTLDIWDQQLADYGKKIIERRKQFLEELEVLLIPIHRNLTNGTETIRISYDASIESEKLYHTLAENRERDIRQKITSAGPHRDDILFSVEGTDMRRFGSQGQQRTIALSLKLAQISLVKQMIHDTPVLLLDDVMSELDAGRQNHLLESLNQGQTFITCTGLEGLVENRFTVDNVFQVVKGAVFAGKEHSHE